MKIFYFLFFCIFFCCNQSEQTKKSYEGDSVKYIPLKVKKNFLVRGYNFDIFSMKLLDTIKHDTIIFPIVKILKNTQDSLHLEFVKSYTYSQMVKLKKQYNYYEYKSYTTAPHESKSYEYDNNFETIYFFKDKIISYDDNIVGNKRMNLKVLVCEKDKFIEIDIQRKNIEKYHYFLDNFSVNHNNNLSQIHTYFYDKKRIITWKNTKNKVIFDAKIYIKLGNKTLEKEFLAFKEMPEKDFSYFDYIFKNFSIIE